MFYVYIIRGKSYQGKNCSYTGYTGNLEQRIATHRRKKKFCRRWELVHLEVFKTKKEATRRESEFKMWKRSDNKTNRDNIKWRQELIKESFLIDIYQELIDKVLMKY